MTLPTQMDVDGQALVLNGTATRKKFIVKVYVAALYLPARETDAERILGAGRAASARHPVRARRRDKKKTCAMP